MECKRQCSQFAAVRKQRAFAFLPYSSNHLVSLSHRPRLTAEHRARNYSLSPHARPTALAAPTPTEEDNNNEDEDPEVSRRVFLAGISATSVVTALAGYRFVIGEDLESRVRLRIAQRFPSLFPREQTPAERRKPLNPTFAAAYFHAVQDVAVKMGITSAAELRREEEDVKRRAYRLFFENQPARDNLGDHSWLNFVLYSRLHVIAQRTSPRSRIEFVERLSGETMKLLVTKPTGQSEEEARVHSEVWVEGLRGLLNECVGLGWISGFRIEDFDGDVGSSWQDEKRATLTVYAFDPVTIQAAQLIGEEQFEEISPKPSGWMKAFLMGSGIKATYEDYYLDDMYRPDPEQFKPSQLATQFDLSL